MPKQNREAENVLIAKPDEPLTGDDGSRLKVGDRWVRKINFNQFYGSEVWLITKINSQGYWGYLEENNVNELTEADVI